MCTAITFEGTDFYFGRNLDLEYHYREQITITPRNYPLTFRNGSEIDTHYGIIGMATVADNYPLYYDATNEKGLNLAGLNFPGNAVYQSYKPGKTNIASFELIPWLLAQCATVGEALNLLKNASIWDKAFHIKLPPTPLHWLLADKANSVVLEPMSDGLHIHKNPIGVLTNNPPFDYHMHHLTQYMNVTAQIPTNRFSKTIPLNPYSLGMGAVGLPGDPSSASRFVRAAFVKTNSLPTHTESESISQFFHILGSVAQQKGITQVRDEEYEFTLYSSCCNADKGIYYYTTYENSQISAVAMNHENLNMKELICYPLITGQQIHLQNGEL